MQITLVPLIASLPWFTDASALVITSPPNEATFYEGDTVTIKVEPSPDDPHLTSVIIFAPPNADPQTIDACLDLIRPPYECQVTLEHGSLRKVNIGAGGKPLSGKVIVAEEITIFINITATLTGLRVNDDQPTIFSFVDNVEGLYSDGIERSLEGAGSGTTYETSDPEIVTVDAEGLITSVAPGEAVITVKNGRLSLKIEVIVGAN